MYRNTGNLTASVEAGDDLVVALGPAVSGPCYQVGKEVVEAVTAAVPNKASLPEAGALLPDEQPGRYRL